jgi:hypothetical protein
MRDLKDTYNRPFFGTSPTPRYKHDTKVFQPNLSKANTPANTLYNHVKRKKIPISDPDFTLDENARYTSANVDDNYELIKQAINKVTPDNINDSSPPIIAIKRPSHIAPYLYYIRKDLLNIDEPESEVTTWNRRKKKTAKSKPKRKIVKRCRCKK